MNPSPTSWKEDFLERTFVFLWLALIFFSWLAFDMWGIFAYHIDPIFIPVTIVFLSQIVIVPILWWLADFLNKFILRTLAWFGLMQTLIYSLFWLFALPFTDLILICFEEGLTLSSSLLLILFLPLVLPGLVLGCLLMPFYEQALIKKGILKRDAVLAAYLYGCIIYAFQNIGIALVTFGIGRFM